MLLIYLPLIFLGYGSDVDTFRVLDTGRNFMATADYVPSRRPGYVVYEMSAYLLDQIGGSVLTNLGTLSWAYIALDSFQRICRRRRMTHPGLLTVILAVHPLFLYNATVTMDYVWALGMTLAGFDLLEQERLNWAGLAFGLAIGCRISSVIVAAGVIGYAWLRWPNQRVRLAATGILTALVAMLAYVLPWDFAGWRASFWLVSAGPADLWTPLMAVGRFLYKNLYFWGLPAIFCLAYLIRRSCRNLSQRRNCDSLFFAGLSVGVIVLVEALFFRFPIEIEYLLPALPFWLFLVGDGVSSEKLLRLLLICVLSYNLVNINLARPDLPGQASQAFLGVWIEPGYLVKEITTRQRLMACDSHACYDEVIGQRPGLEAPAE